jgi:3-oxoacyl-[acyl-carrier protein] reductase
MTGVTRSVLITGAGRREGIAATLARVLASDGWDVGLTCWRPYDAGLPWPTDPTDPRRLVDEIRSLGVRAAMCEADLADETSPSAIFDQLYSEIGSFTALFNVHCHSSPGGLLDTTIEDFNQHMRVNAGATFQMCAEFARRFSGEAGTGRIINFTSDALVGEVAYGASKAAVDRITIAGAAELGPRGITVNALNPGPIDTGWMTDEQREFFSARTPLRRLGTPGDTAHLVRFLLSPQGGWITGQVLYSNGGGVRGGRAPH